MRVTVPKVLALGFSVMLVGYVFMVAPRMHAASAAHVPQAAPGTAAAPTFPPFPCRLTARPSRPRAGSLSGS